jgi:hypothetical protein
VSQYHFTDWPDFGVADSTASIISLVNIVRNELKGKGDNNPYFKLHFNQIDRIFAQYFHPLGDCLLWAAFRKLQKYIVHFFPRIRLCITFDNIWVGLHFWAIISQTDLVTLMGGYRGGQIWPLFYARGKHQSRSQSYGS